MAPRLAALLCLAAALPTASCGTGPTRLARPGPAAGSASSPDPRLSALQDAPGPPARIDYSAQTRLVRGWRVHIDRRLEQGSPDHPAGLGELGARALELLDAKLLGAERALPPQALARLKSVEIWLSLDSAAGPGAVYHPSAQWLSEHGFDPSKAGGLEIANAANFLDWSREQPAMVLHELAHAYHHQVLGYDDASVRECFQRVRAAKSLDQVLHAGGRRERAYALNNEQEFFAEMSEAWWGTNDYFPFVRAELAESFPEVAALMRSAWER